MLDSPTNLIVTYPTTPTLSLTLMPPMPQFPFLRLGHDQLSLFSFFFYQNFAYALAPNKKDEMRLYKIESSRILCEQIKKRLFNQPSN